MPEIKVGQSWPIHYSENNPNNQRIHIRAVVDGDQVVNRWWSRRRKRWTYEIVDIEFFELLWRNGNLRP